MAAKKLTASPVGLTEPQLKARTEAASFYLRGQAHLKTGDPNAALNDFRRANSLDNKFTPAWLGNALASHATGNWDGMIRALGEVEKLEPELIIPYRERLAECHLMRARQYGTNRYLQDTVIADLRMVIQLDPAKAPECQSMFAEALFVRGTFRASQNNQHAQAVADFTEGLSQFPDDIRFRRERCRLLLKVENYSLALEDLDHLQAQEPGDEWVWQRADALRGLKRTEEALTLIDAHIARRPDHIPSLQVRSEIHADLNLFDAALNDLDRILKVSPDSEEFLLRRSDLHARLGDLKSAEADVTSALGRNKNKGTLLLKRSGIREKAGRNALAVADLDVVLKQEPWNATGLKCRAYLHVKMGNYELAEVDIKQWTRRDKREPEIYWLPGVIAVMREQWPEAQAYFRSACRRGSQTRFIATKDLLDFKMGKKGALSPDYARLRTIWKDDFAVLAVIDKLDPVISQVVPPASPEVPAKKSKKKPSGNREGEMSA